MFRRRRRAKSDFSTPARNLFCKVPFHRPRRYGLSKFPRAARHPLNVLLQPR